MSRVVKQPQVAVYACDVCEKESDRPFPIAVTGRWYSDDLDEDFCSAPCLAEWAHGHASLYRDNEHHISLYIQADGGADVSALLDLVAGHR